VGVEPKNAVPVALIAPYAGMAELAGEIQGEFEKPILIEVGDLLDGVRKGNDLAARGVEVVISRGGTALLLKKHLQLPIAEIKVTAYDILQALQKVGSRGQRIGIIGFGNVIYGAGVLGTLLNLDLTVFAIQKREEVALRLDEAKKARVDIIIGDKVVVSQANERGYPSILIESGKEAILQSFHEAYQILEVVRSETRKSREYLETLQRLRAVLDSVEDQIVILDAQGRIQLCNPAAQRIFRKKEEALKGSPLTVYPVEFLMDLDGKTTAGKNHLVCLTGKQLLLDYIPIETRGERSGTLILGRSVDKLQQAERKVRHELYLKGHITRFTFSDIVTGNDHFRKVIQKANRFAASASTILIQGETGTGKEMFAQSIHQENFGPERPFVAINCATLPEPLLESELFGYAPGAFTGARKEGKKGLFELAHGGTLLLDEISELPLNLQSRLLRVIEEREVHPIGDDRVIPVDIRIIAVTNRDLAGEVRERRFREDLFYRLAVLELKIPPLRERGSDAWDLFRHFILKVNPDAEPGPMFQGDVQALLCGYPWPGNVRELRNLVERLSMLTEGFCHVPDDIAEGIQGELGLSSGTENAAGDQGPETLSLKEMEQRWLERVCGASTLNKKELAKRLGVSRTTLWKRTRKG